MNKKIVSFIFCLSLVGLTGCSVHSKTNETQATVAIRSDETMQKAEKDNEAFAENAEDSFDYEMDGYYDYGEEVTEATTEEPTFEEKCRQEFSGKLVGDFVTFGDYQPAYDDGITWQIIDLSEKNKYMLISAQCLDTIPYHDTDEEITWEDCTLRKWLNNDFIKASFVKKERAMICETTVLNCDGGADTKDKVFLLTEEEALDAFDSDEERAASPTSYAVERGIYVNSGMISDIGVGNTQWWLRGGADVPNNYMTEWVSSRGETRWNMVVNEQGVGVRPVIWVEIPGMDEEKNKERTELAGTWTHVDEEKGYGIDLFIEDIGNQFYEISMMEIYDNANSGKSWEMTGEYDEATGRVNYSNAYCCKNTYDEAIKDTTVEVWYRDGRGYFYMKDGKVYWNDAEENAGEGCVFQ